MDYTPGGMGNNKVSIISDTKEENVQVDTNTTRHILSLITCFSFDRSDESELDALHNLLYCLT